MQSTNTPVPMASGGQNSSGGLSGPSYCKMLVSSSIAGSIIGKSGSEIATIERETGCTMRLSSNDIFFPGTQQRICSISGSLDSINAALLIVLNKLTENAASSNFSSRKDLGMVDQLQQGGGENSMGGNQGGRDNNHPRFTCSLVVPKTAVSAIIGKGGQTIKTLAENTGAKVVVSERENGLNERIVFFSGSYDAVKNAVLTVVQDTQSDGNLRDCCMQLEYRSMAYADAPHGNHGIIMPQSGGFGGTENVGYPGVQQHVLSTKCEIMMHIPDSAMGAIIGKQGSSMSEIMRRSGAKITVSQKGEVVPGTTNRVVTLTGTLLATHQAHALLIQQCQIIANGYESSHGQYNNNGFPSSNRRNDQSYMMLGGGGVRPPYGGFRDEGANRVLNW